MKLDLENATKKERKLVSYSVNKDTAEKFGEICREKKLVLAKVIEALLVEFIDKYGNAK